MIFPKRKVERAMKWSRERRAKADGVPVNEDGTIDEENLPTTDELREVNIQDEMEKGDMGAMILAGCLTIIPIAVAVLAVLGLLCILLVGGF